MPSVKQLAAYVEQIFAKKESPTFTGTVTLPASTAISTAVLASPVITTPTITGSPVGTGVLQYTEVSITNAEMLALRATGKTLVAAPGAGYFIDLISCTLFFDYTGAYTETADNLGLLYGGILGTTVGGTVETTGFVDATADTMTSATISVLGNIAKATVDNQAVVLCNTGDGEFGGGNADNVVRVRTSYRIVPAGW